VLVADPHALAFLDENADEDGDECRGQALRGRPEQKDRRARGIRVELAAAVGKGIRD
jgi:hypothetical protein